MVVVLLLVERVGAQGGVFLSLMGCLLLDHQLTAVLELRDPICGWSPADLLRAVLEPLASISSWSIRAQLMAVLELWDPVSG